MRKFYLFTSCIFLVLCTLVYAQEPKKHTVLVSIGVYQPYIQEMTDNYIQVEQFVPEHVSFHSYEPTPSQMEKARHADIWFTIGERFEERAQKALKQHFLQLEYVDLQHDIVLHTEHSCCHAHTKDLHTWLSLHNMKIQLQTIASALSRRYSEIKNTIQERLKTILNRLDTLDHEIRTLLAPYKGRKVIVTHAAYGYFCHDYNIEQVALEEEGKDSSIKHLHHIRKLIQDEEIPIICTQKQYNSKAARVLADELTLGLIELDPYGKDYENNMRNIALTFKKALEPQLEAHEQSNSN